jgi:DNA-binding PadR family transcriptional regulator
MTGYDLKTQSFDRTVAHFWPADQAQIYRTLDKLAEQGLITSIIEMQTDRPNRKVYSITDAGRAELQQWLLKPQELPLNRESFLVQLFFGGHLTNTELLAQLDAQLELHQQKLALYEQITAPMPDELPHLDRSTRLTVMTLDMGIRLEKMYIDWLQDCIVIVQTLPDRAPSP